MLNRALRTLEANIIIKMGFFIRDLHREIEHLHSTQWTNDRIQPLTVYRGQTLSKIDFNKIMKTKGGLISFNSFLSTSRDLNVSLIFAESNFSDTDSIGILFKITIDPSLASTPFANIDNVSDHSTEQEVLFSMHTIFRIGDIKQLDNDNRLYQIDLTSTNDDDVQLKTLTEQIRTETVLEQNGWYRLGILLTKIGEFTKAEELYSILLDQATDDVEKTSLYCSIGASKSANGNYTEAIWLYEKALQTAHTTFPSDHAWFGTAYNNISQVLINQGNYRKALLFLERALEIQHRNLPSNHPSLATSYNNIGLVYDNMAEYSTALSFYEKALEFHQKELPSNHPSLATSYNNIGLVYKNMGDYSEALLFYKKALGIRQKTLPSNHPDLAASYNNIGLVYDSMGDYPKALSSHEKALAIQQQSLPPNHPDLAGSYNNIGNVYNSMGDYPKALSFYEKALGIQREALPPNHPSFAISYKNIGLVYKNMGEYSKAGG